MNPIREPATAAPHEVCPRSGQGRSRTPMRAITARYSLFPRSYTMDHLMSLPLSCRASRSMAVAKSKRGLLEYRAAPSSGNFFREVGRCGDGRHAFGWIVRGRASDIARWPTSQMKPASSRAMATTAMFFCFPRAMNSGLCGRDMGPAGQGGRLRDCVRGNVRSAGKVAATRIRPARAQRISAIRLRVFPALAQVLHV